MELNDRVLDHLRAVAGLPDVTGTRYELGEEIGRGGMAVVYRARDRELGRAVALKVFDSPLAGEAQLMAQLEHPAIVPVYESGTLADGRMFYAMKLVTGERLDRFAAGEASLAERLRIIRRAGEAVALAHRRGVMHRDLKPQNVMVGEFGEVYVMDWGVEAVAGTPGFCAPEGAVDARSDIYSFGALLRCVLPSPAPAALSAVVRKAMSAEAAGRYADMAGLLADIENFQEGLPVGAWREPLWHRAQRFTSRNAVLLWLLGAYAAVKFALFFLRNF